MPLPPPSVLQAMWFNRLPHILLVVVWTLTVYPPDTAPRQQHPVSVQSVTGGEGDMVTLSCEFSISEDHRTTQVIEWLHKGLVLPIYIRFGVHPPRIDAAYLGRLSLVDGASLRMERLRTQDEGWYRCRILFLTHPYHSQNGTWIYLSVSTLPSFRLTPPAVVEIRLGEPARLTCDAWGRPQPVITWSKDGVALPLPLGHPAGQQYQVVNGSVVMPAVGRGATGVYTCRARNAEGTIAHSSTLLVMAPPVIVRAPSDLTVNYTQDALFSCHAEAYPGNLSYSWYKDGINVHHDSTLRDRVSVLTDGSLLVRNTVPEDSGRYTCVPSNGLEPPSEATASLHILHPAYTRPMPSLTILPVGMRGQIPCPWVANPPLLYINWTRNRAALDVEKVPGWYMDSIGTIVIAMGNDDVLGEYTCTPYNSYGTLGESGPTRVILKDPPRFLTKPVPRYQREVGQELSINCTATGQPEARINWTKEGDTRPRQFQVLEDGTLFFRSIRKEHHGTWVCKARDNLTEISTSTTVWVTGTSPHAVTNLTVRPDVFAVNVSWEPGFDGGHPQQFTVWFRQTSHGPHDWIIHMVPDGDHRLSVDHLWPNTSYQFSVLAQSDRGSGPFSQIINTHTLCVPTATATPRRPPAPSERARPLLPPSNLAANRTAGGIVLRWAPPPAPSLLPLAYVLEYRGGPGAWEVLHSAIPAQQDRLLLTGLVKDVSYQFRMVSQSEELVSEPSDIVNVSTSGMSSYPSGETVWEPFTHSVRAGIIAGVCFLTTALIISILVSHVMRLRRESRLQNVPIVFSHYQKTPNIERSDSPDSLLKLKLESPVYETFERVAVPPGKTGRRKAAQYETHLGCLESIRRGADGRFVVGPEPAISPNPAPPCPGPCPQVQQVQARPPLRPKAHGQAWARPRACYFTVGTSSPADGSQPPPSPDISPIAPGCRPAAPQQAPTPPDAPTPGTGRGSLFELGPVAIGDRGPGRVSPLPGPSSRPGHPQRVCSQASGSRTLLREPSMSLCPLSVPSETTASSLAPNSSGYHSEEASWLLREDRRSNKRGAPAEGRSDLDAGLAMSSEILDALRVYQRARRPHSSILLHDLTLTGCVAPSGLRRSGTVQSLVAPGSLQGPRSSRQDTESRCAALWEEFQEYRRHKEREKAGRARVNGNFELATLL